MSLVSYLSLSKDPGKMAYEVRRTLNTYRIFLDRQIQCIDMCNVVKKAEWILLPDEKENVSKSPKNSNADKENDDGDIEKNLYKISLKPINDKDDLDVFFTEENISQLYEIDPVEDKKKIVDQEQENLKKIEEDSKKDLEMIKLTMESKKNDIIDFIIDNIMQVHMEFPEMVKKRYVKKKKGKK